MDKTRNIVEYKRAGDKEWRMIFATCNYDTALTQFEDAKKSIPDAAEIRIRVKVSQSEIVEEWRRE